MSRRERILRKTCAENGCTEFARWSFSSLRELKESYEAKQKDWWCVRHKRKDEVLSTSNNTTERTLVSVKSINGSDKLFWSGGSGFAYGPGFKAFADDFPEGTQLIVTARISIP